jgi:hypothetical protein
MHSYTTLPVLAWLQARSLKPLPIVMCLRIKELDVSGVPVAVSTRLSIMEVISSGLIMLSPGCGLPQLSHFSAVIS